MLAWGGHGCVWLTAGQILLSGSRQKLLLRKESMLVSEPLRVDGGWCELLE